MANVETCRAIEIIYTVLFSKLGTNSSSSSASSTSGDFSSLMRQKSILQWNLLMHADSLQEKWHTYCFWGVRFQDF